MNKAQALEIFGAIKKDYRFYYLDNNPVTRYVFFPKNESLEKWSEIYLRTDIKKTSEIISAFPLATQLDLYLIAVIKNTNITLSISFEEHLARIGLKSKFLK